MSESERIAKDAELIKDEYEWLLTLNDDSLSDQVKRTNDVQNALIELLELADDVIEYFSKSDNN